MKDLRWGIIGFGAFADVAMGPAITGTDGHELVAIMGRNKSKIEDYARKYTVQYVYDSWWTMRRSRPCTWPRQIFSTAHTRFWPQRRDFTWCVKSRWL